MATAFTFWGIDLGLGKVPARALADHHARLTALRLANALMATAIAVAAASARAVEATPPPAGGTACGEAQIVGVFTGKYVNGVPIYRLPPVTVVGNRKADLATTNSPADRRAQTVSVGRS